MIFRFIGTECQIGDFPPLQSFGAAIDLPETLAREIIAPAANPERGSALLPDATFQAIGFTADELAAHRWVSSHADAPAEFQKKKAAALAALTETRKRIASGGPTAPEKSKKGGE